MHTMDRIVLAVKAMSQEEKDALAAALWPLLFEGLLPDYSTMSGLARAESTGLSGATASKAVMDEYAEAEASLASKPKRKGGGRGKKRPYWLKRVTSWIEGKKGGYGIEGDWVWSMKDLPSGTRVVMGFTVEGTSMWAVVEARPGMTTSVGAYDLTFTVEDAVTVQPATTDWGRIRSAAA